MFIGRVILLLVSVFSIGNVEFTKEEGSKIVVAILEDVAKKVGLETFKIEKDVIEY